MELVLVAVILVAAAVIVGLAVGRRRLGAAVRTRDERLAAVTHELRGPLQPIALAVSRLKRDGTLTPRQKEAVEIIERNLEAQTRMIEDLWEATRGQRELAVRVEPCDLNATLAELVDAARPRADDRKVALEAVLDPDGPVAAADPVRLRQVVRNLIDNAIKFTPAGGRVRVSSDQGAGREVRIEVADTGSGIVAEDQQRIFDPYVQLPGGSEAGGVGLGLHLARKLVQAQGGTLEVSSEGTGRGSTFTVLLPRAVTSAVQDPSGSSPAGRRLLLAEDHEDSARMIGELLRGRGYDVTSVGTLAAGIAAAERSRFDVLVSDLELPDGSGLDLMRKLGANGRAVRGIALSGRRTDEDLAASRAAGFAAHLLKPIDFDALVKEIEGPRVGRGPL